MPRNLRIGFVHEGEDAVIKLEAFPFTRYGTVPGKIKIVSEDAVSNPASGGAASQSPSPLAGEGRGEGSLGAGSSGSALFYTARVTLGRTTLNIDGPSSEAQGAQEGKPVNLEPGMAATVNLDIAPGLVPGVKTGKRKLIEFLLSPLMKMRDEAGRER